MNDSAVVLLREIRCWSLLGFNRLIFLLVSFFIDESTLTCLCFKVLPPKLTVISELTPNQSSVLRQNFLSTSNNLLDFSPVYSGKSGLKKAQLKKGDDKEKIVSRTCNNHPAENPNWYCNINCELSCECMDKIEAKAVVKKIHKWFE